MSGTGQAEGPAGRGLRADARRNRAKVLAVAAEVFATEGLSVPVHEIARRAGYDLARLRDMLVAAQQAGAVRPDVSYPDVKALMAGCLARETADPAGLDPLIAVICQGLRL